MKPLRLTLLNIRSPYKVWSDEKGYHFITDYNLAYSFEFCSYDIEIVEPAYWFNLYNMTGKPSPNDKKLQETIVCVIEEFFQVNPNILLYMCDTADDQQAVRSRLFLRWFNHYAHRDEYVIRVETVRDEGVDNYIALIIQKNNPSIVEVVQNFENQIKMFKENK